MNDIFEIDVYFVNSLKNKNLSLGSFDSAGPISEKSMQNEDLSYYVLKIMISIRTMLAATERIK